jgi:hypothetical protein
MWRSQQEIFAQWYLNNQNKLDIEDFVVFFDCVEEQLCKILEFFIGQKRCYSYLKLHPPTSLTYAYSLSVGMELAGMYCILLSIRLARYHPQNLAT